MDIELKNSDNLPKELIELLFNQFKVLQKRPDTISERIIKYLIDGEDEVLLHEINNILGDIVNEAQKQNPPNQTHSWINLQNYLQPYFEAFSFNKIRDYFQKNYELASPHFLLRLNRLQENFHKSQHGHSFRFWHVNSIPFGGNENLGVFLQFWNNNLKSLPITLLETLYETAGDNSLNLLRTILFADQNNYNLKYTVGNIANMKGFADFIAKYPKITEEALNQSKAEQKIYVLNLINERKIPFESHLEVIVELSCSSSKQIRSAALPLVKKQSVKALPFLENIATKGSAESRFFAVKLLHELSGDKSLEFLTKRLEQEKAPKVRELIDNIINPKVEIDSKEEFKMSVPPLPEIETNVPLNKDFFNIFRETIEKIDTDNLAYYEKFKSQNQWLSKPSVNSPERIAKGFDLLQNGTANDCQKNIIHGYHKVILEVMPKLVEEPNSKPIHLIRLICLCGNTNNLVWSLSQFSRFFKAKSENHFGLRELAQTLNAVAKGDKDFLAYTLLNQGDWYNRNLKAFMETDEDIWQFFVENLGLVEQALFSDDVQKRQNALTYLAKFPQIPPKFLSLLWEFALGKSKSDRLLAQTVLEKDPKKFEKLVVNLTNRSAEVRTMAAEWLGRGTNVKAIEFLHQALSVEKSEIAKDAMLRGLEKLGADVAVYFNRDELQQEAVEGLKKEKKILDSISWFQFELAPQVVWADTKKPVSREIWQWFMVQSIKQKMIEPSPMLARYCSMFDKTGRENFGKFVLESWIAQDIKPIPPDEAEKMAKTTVSQIWSHQWNVNYYQQQGITQEKLFQDFFSQNLKKPVGSAIKEKGMLAVSAACSGTDLAGIAQRYLKEWHGHRLAQGKCLVEMLGFCANNSAIQVLLSLANRFRTKGIQEEAKRQVDLIAERKGWTLEQLADRTIPTLGFDEKGKLTLDFGSRHFIVRLDSKNNFILTDGEGKKLKSLPEPRKDDDPELAKEAKATFSAAKKGQKQLLQTQQERLFEAMCVQREWIFGDWLEYLKNHPIVGRMTQTLVWQELKSEMTFRPLDDGSLTDSDDNEVTFDTEAKIRLAHTFNVSPEIEKAWQNHLADYEVEQIFPQFDRNMVELTDKLKQSTELKDFEGHLIETFKLRGKATALGYARGQTEDAGWFYFYNKSFPTLKLQAHLEFTGNFLPEENRTAALIGLSFSQIDPESYYYSASQGLPLSEIPPVLLCETWNDLRTIAAQGFGFDPNWKKISEY